MIRFGLGLSTRVSRLAVWALTIVVLFSASLSANAETIFSEDFQNGKTEGWVGSGEGDLRLTTYQDNISLRMQYKSAAVRKISTMGFRSVSMTVAIAAQNLEPQDACFAEVSTDGGKTWAEMLKVGDGQDDAITLHPGGGTTAGLDDNANVLVGLRASATRRDGTCWADNIQFFGTPKKSADLAGRIVPVDLLALNPDKGLDAPFDFRVITASAGAKSSTVNLTGRIRFELKRARLNVKVMKDTYNAAAANGGSALTLPDFDFQFIQSGDRVVPVVRGPVVNSHPDWEWIVEPGRSWREGNDTSLTRVMIPVSLQEKNANCTHNGAMFFGVDAKGALTPVMFQIASETCAYFQFDAWGLGTAAFSAGGVSNVAAIKAAFEQELKNRLPVRPLSELAKAFVGVDVAQFASPAEVPTESITTFGVMIDGVHYSGGCQTRAGPYPDCSVLDLPSYSVAKSIFAGLGAMRLEKIAPGSLTKRISELVPECALPQWEGVSLAQALNMSTGNYDSPAYMADEDAPRSLKFFLALDHATKIGEACTRFSRKAAPGSTWVYHTFDTYILGTGFRRLLAAIGQGDPYEGLVVEPLWRAWGLSPVIMSTKRTYDSERQPFTGWGLTLHADDIVRIARMLRDPAVRQYVDMKMLNAALQLDPADRGLPAGGEAFRYKNGFWAWNAASALGCSNPSWIPFLSGYGGIIVALMPNNSVYYYVSDGGVHAWARAAAQLNKIRPFC